MQLSEFISSLLNKGEVKVIPVLHPFDEEELRLAQVHLLQHYTDDVNEMPATAPAYDADAALWAATYLYRTVQFLLLRHLEASAIATWLPPYAGEQTAAAVYSADLTLRYLPDLFLLAKGISPEDPLVVTLNTLAGQWPLSAAMIPGIPPDQLSVVLEHPSLRRCYTDRILLARDFDKCSHPACLPFIQEALGAYSDKYWPQFNIDLTAHT